ncbi:PLP-dependent aminotransferase family protein [Hyphomicrobiales bacterium 4NK60-0047b]
MLKAAENVALMLNVNTGRPLQAQLFEQVRAMIIEGQLTSGTPLPATRALSEQLGVSRNTVVLAYDRLLAEGYIESKRSIGTFVSDAIPDNGLIPQEVSAQEVETQVTQTVGTQIEPPFSDLEKFEADTNLSQNTSPSSDEQYLPNSTKINSYNPDPLVIDFKPGAPDVEAFPVRTWRRLLNRKLMQIDDYYHEAMDPLGSFDLRRAIAEHLGPARGIIAKPEDVVIVSSVQEARALLAQLLLTEGAPTIMEAPGPDGIAQLFSHYKTNIYGIEVDEDGLHSSALPELDASSCFPHENTRFYSNEAFYTNPNSYTNTASGMSISSGMAYVTPSHHFPLGVSMALSRRIQLLEWAHKTGIMVVEDESTSDFRYGGSPLTALKGLDSRLTGNGDTDPHPRDERVIYLGGFKKSLGIQIGYLVVPSFLIPAVHHLKTLGFGAASWLEQATLAEFIDNGAYDRHLRKLRKKCKEKRDLLISLLTKHFGDDIALSGMEGGLHLIWDLPKQFGTADAVSKRMLETHRIGLYGVQSGGSTVVTNSAIDEQALIFGYASLTLEDIETGVLKLAAEIKTKNGTEQ